MLDRRVKERLVGAAILVAVVVLVVPELLSGPPGPPPPAVANGPLRSYTVDVADNGSTAEPVENAAPGRTGSAVSGTVVRAPDAPPAEPVRLADPTEVKRPAPQARQKAAANGWSVQLGSFASEANAQKLVRELRARGFTVFMVSGGTGKATRHRVLVGPWSDHEAALEAAAKLKAQGHSVSVLSPSA